MRSSKTFKLLRSVLLRHWFLSAACLFAVCLGSLLLSVASTEMLRKILSALEMSYSSILHEAVWQFGVVLVLLLLCQVLEKVTAFLLSRHATYEIEDHALQHYSNLAYWFEPSTPEAALLYIRHTIPEVSANAITSFLGWLRNGIIIISSGIYAWTISPPILLISLAIIALIILLSNRGVSRLPFLLKDYLQKYASMDEKIWEQIHNHEVAGMLNPKRVQQGYVKQSDVFISAVRQLIRVNNRTLYVSKFGPLFMIIVAVAVGGYLSAIGSMALYDIYAMVLLIPIVANSLFTVPASFAEYKKLHGCFSSMDIFFTWEKQMPKSVSEAPDNLLPLMVKKLSFTYPGQETPAIDGIEFSINSGLLCIVGSSGCGKSTLLKLLTRALPRQEGEILVNGIDVMHIDRKDYYDRIAYLEQQPHLLSGTLRFNIILRRKEDEGLLHQALKDADILELISRLPNGLDTMVDASEFSSGEIQKICWARLFYGKHQILLLDEATAALDPAAEASILYALDHRIKSEGLLALCVTHRPAVLTYAQQLLLLQDGKLIACTGYETMKDNSIFQKVMAEED